MTDSADHNLVIIAGMPRAGTTSLYHVLAKHPAFYASYRKETAYFSYNYHKGVEWYRDLFRGRKPHQLGLDISPQYFMDRRSIDRIVDFCEHPKVIMSVRDPVEWIVSLFRQINKFEHKNSFAEFLDRFTVTAENETLECSFADGYVTETLNQYKEKFGDNLLLYDFSYFQREPLDVLNNIERFLGVDAHFNPSNFENVQVNAYNQRNIRWLTWLLSRELTIDVLTTVFPRFGVQKGRLLFDRLTRVETDKSASDLDSKASELAQQRLGTDRSFVAEMFEGKPIQTGTGARFNN